MTERKQSAFGFLRDEDAGFWYWVSDATTGEPLGVVVRRRHSGVGKYERGDHLPWSHTCWAGGQSKVDASGCYRTREDAAKRLTR